MDIKKLLEKLDQFAGQAVGQKPGDQVRGTEKAKKGGKEHPFKGRLVGDSVDRDSLLKDLSKLAEAKGPEWELAEEYARFLEAEFKDTEDGRPARKGSREEKVGKRGHKEQPRYKTIKEASGDGDVANAVVAEVIKLIGEGHTEVSPDVITTKVSAALGRPFMLKDLVAANNASPELQHYIDSINPSKIKFSTDILTVKNQDPVKEKEKSQAGVSAMASRAASRPRLGESVNEGWGHGQDRVSLPDTPSTYWNGKGQLYKEYIELYKQLVPDQGPADTIEGEVLRAASKIVYRHYNDGDEFNQASYSQLEPYIGKVSSYDDLAHKATVFALAAEGQYHPNAGWDCLDVMEYGPEDYDDEDEDNYDDYYDDQPDWDQDEVDEGFFGDLTKSVSTGYANGLRKGLRNTISPEHHDEYDIDSVLTKDQAVEKLKAAKANGHIVPKTEGWESGPEERAPRERDPDWEYEQHRQEKIDAPHIKQEPEAKGYHVVSMDTRQPVTDKLFATKGEAMAYIMQNHGKNLAYRAVNEGKTVPVITAFRKAMEKIANSDMNPQAKQAAFDRLSAEFHKNAQAYSDAVKSKRKVNEYSTTTPGAAPSTIGTAGAPTANPGTIPGATTDPNSPEAKAQAAKVAQATGALKSASGSKAPTANITKAINAATQGQAVGQQDMKALEPVMDIIGQAAQDPKLANQFRTLAQQAKTSATQQQQQQQPK